VPAPPQEAARREQARYEARDAGPAGEGPTSTSPPVIDEAAMTSVDSHLGSIMDLLDEAIAKHGLCRIRLDYNADKGGWQDPDFEVRVVVTRKIKRSK
jgi:hypothetical protein